MRDTPVLLLDGELKGQIREIENPDLGLVSVEKVGSTGDGSFFDFADYRQVHYRARRFQCFDRAVWVGWCGPEAQPPIAGLLELLLSDLAKQLLQLTNGEKAS